MGVGTEGSFRWRLLIESRSLMVGRLKCHPVTPTPFLEGGAQRHLSPPHVRLPGCSPGPCRNPCPSLGPNDACKPSHGPGPQPATPAPSDRCPPAGPGHPYPCLLPSAPLRPTWAPLCRLPPTGDRGLGAAEHPQSCSELGPRCTVKSSGLCAIGQGSSVWAGPSNGVWMLSHRGTLGCSDPRQRGWGPYGACSMGEIPYLKPMQAYPLLFCSHRGPAYEGPRSSSRVEPFAGRRGA